MLVQLKSSDESTVATISGTIDTNTAQQLQDALKAADPSKKLICDFADVKYITSAGLRTMLIMRKFFPSDKMLLINVSREVNEVFKITGFDGILPVTLAGKNAAKYVSLSLKDFLKKKVAEAGANIAVIAGGDSEMALCDDMAKATTPSDGTSYNWIELDKLSQIIARDLWNQGVRKGTHVGLMAGNSVNWISTFFAIQKLGALALLVNFNLKATEVQAISKIGDITHLCYGDIAETINEEEFISIITDSEKSSIRHTYSMGSHIKFRERENEYAALEGYFAEPVDSDDPAVVIFTSGSTGKPKAVLLSAFNLLNSASVFAEGYHIDNTDRVCLVIPLFHIFGLVVSLLGNFINDSIVVIPKNLHTATILNTIRTEKCTQLYSVPTLLLAIANSKSFEPSAVATLRCIIMGGASATASQIVELQKAFPNAFFAATYGLSEMAPVAMTAYNDSDEHVTQTVGKPVKNIEICIMDFEKKTECPRGKSGEIWVKGFNTMVCYYKIALDDQPLDEEGWLHTGDLGVMDEDGYLRLVGRAKELIIRGGENIAASEVAEAISQFPSVKDVKVQGVPDDFYGEVVGASVVMKDHAPLDTHALLAFLSTKLAKYKIPSFIFQYDSLPLLSNGKVDAVGLKKDMNAKAAALRK